MRVGIDARFVGPEGTGLGKYTEKLIANLQKIDTKNNYVIFLRKANWSYLKLNATNFQKKLADVPWYSLEEQFKMPAIYNQANLDLLHVPHFNVPIFYRKKFVVTIHDLIHHHFSQESTSTRNPLLFKLKRFGYKVVIANAIKGSKKIIVPSNFVKREIVENFKIKPDKIVVTYEAAEEEYQTSKKQSSGDYILYVGNAYPHKNLNTLLDALKILSTNYKLSRTSLTIVSPRSVFTERLESEVEKRCLKNKVKVIGYQEPAKLAQIFTSARAYIFPSLSEGFGIPGLNAMAAGVPVIASKIPTLREIYQDAAVYFNPKDSKDIAQTIITVLNSSKKRQELIERGQKQAKKYSWLEMAKQTLSVYRSV